VTAADIARIVAANHHFHFTMFRYSGLNMVVDEIDRIWKMTEAYRTVTSTTPARAAASSGSTAR
jgi:DNA-binding GntR family transcriptional regulator